jgi:hypothetical protein
MNFGLPKTAFRKESNTTSINHEAIAQAQAEVDRLSAYNQVYGGAVQSIVQAREDALNKLEALKRP